MIWVVIAVLNVVACIFLVAFTLWDHDMNHRRR